MSTKIPGKIAKSKRPLRRWALDLALILAALAAIHWWQTHPLASGAAPVLSGRSVSGEALDLSGFRGRSVLVHFWAEWCPVCRVGQGAIQSIADDFPIITVAMQSGDGAAVRDFMKQQSLSFSTIADPQGDIAGKWGVKAVPTSFVIDPDGIIRYSEVGFTTEPGLRARLWAAGSF